MSIFVCTDLDRTLLDENGLIHSQDKEILATRQDIQFVIATGRPLHAVKIAFHRNGLFQDQPLPFALAAVNGSVTYLPGEVLHDHFPFPSPMREQLIDLTQSLSNVSWWFFDVDNVYMRWPSPLSQQVAEDLDTHCQPFDDMDESSRFSKLVCVSGDSDLLHQVGKQAHELAVQVMYGLGFLFEVNPGGVNKGSGVLSLLPSPTNSRRIFAAGDDENDIPLLSLAERSFSPNGANPRIRSMVDQVIDKTERGLLTPMLQTANMI